MVMSVRDNLEMVREAIRQAAARCGRREEDILLVAVTKTRPVEDVVEAVRCGVTSVGENRVQELLEKRALWPGGDEPEWRLIGHLQRNKARKTLSVASAVDSVDSPELAAALSRIAAEEGRTLPVLLEVNTSGETTKHGVAPGEAEILLHRILENCPALRPEGFMTIGPLTGGEKEIRRAFALLRTICEKARSSTGLALPELSMGMSGDFGWAVQEGSTMVRIGSSIFGARR
jgi:pyridoxal phosphate enzyme (YggS family)